MVRTVSTFCSQLQNIQLCARATRARKSRCVQYLYFLRDGKGVHIMQKVLAQHLPIEEAALRGSHAVSGHLPRGMQTFSGKS